MITDIRSENRCSTFSGFLRDRFEWDASFSRPPDTLFPR